MLKKLKIYVESQYKYSIMQSHEVINTFFKSKFNKEVHIKIITYLNIIKKLLNYSVFYLITFVFLDKQNQLSYTEILTLAYSVFFFIPLLNKMKFFHRLFQPVDFPILYTTPLSNKQIFSLSYLSIFIRKKLQDVPYYYILALLVSNQHQDSLLSYWIITCIVYFSGELLGYSMLIVTSKVKLRRVKKGYGFTSFLLVHFIGIILFIGVYSLFRTIFLWSFEVDILQVENYLSQIYLSLTDTLSTLVSLQLKVHTVPAVAINFLLNNESGNIFFVYVLITCIIFIVSFRKSGSWYRKDLKTINSKKKDWISIILNVYLGFSKSIFSKIQIKRMFNSEEMPSSYIFFLFNYYNYIWLGVASAVYGLDINERPIFRILLLYFLFNIISRDSFTSGITWFSNIFRFDGEGRSLEMYKISGVDLYNVYKSKINLERMMGLFDFFILFTAIGLILNLSVYEFLYVLSLSIFNFSCMPHLKILPSYIMPHVNRAHYSETGEYLEEKIWEKNINQNIQTFLFILGLGIPVSMIYFQYPQNYSYMIGSIIYLLLTGFGLLSISVILKKMNPKINGIIGE